MKIVWLILILAISLGLGLIQERPAEKVVFLDVGQGDSILLQDEGTQVVIDGGPGMQVMEALAREIPWMDRRLELVVLTHPQQDHMEGLISLIKRYEVGLVLLPRVSSPSQMQQRWLEILLAENIPYRFAWAGQKINAGDINLEVLYPFDSPTAAQVFSAQANNASVVMRADFAPASKSAGMTGAGQPLSLLLMGDAEKKVERQLVDTYHSSNGRVAGVLDVNILKAGHHGSKTSTTEELLAAASPGAVVISVGEDNKYGHPNREVLDRLVGRTIFRTDQEGSIAWRYLEGRWWVKTRNFQLPIFNFQSIFK